MSYTIKTTMNLVLQELPAGGPHAQLLPWMKGLTDDTTTARMGGGVIPPKSNNVKVDLPGIETATTVWFFPDADMNVSLGHGNSSQIRVLAGGCIGFTHGTGSADDALRVSYDGEAPASYTFIWGGS